MHVVRLIYERDTMGLYIWTATDNFLEGEGRGLTICYTWGWMGRWLYELLLYNADANIYQQLVTSVGTRC